MTRPDPDRPPRNPNRPGRLRRVRHDPLTPGAPTTPEGDDEDLSPRAFDIVAKGLTAIEAEMDMLLSAPISADGLDRIVHMTEKSATVGGHLRRAEEAQYNRRRKLTPDMVRGWLREATPDQRAHALEGFVEGGEPKRSSLE